MSLCKQLNDGLFPAAAFPVQTGAQSAESDAATELSRVIREEIRAAGVISLARFWELALYHPQFGYYERNVPTVGAAGDFITSVTVGPLLGRLLAQQVAQWTESIQQPIQIIEAGAHHGQLAKDILTATRALRQTNIAYHILEPSPRRQARQIANLREFSPQVRWFQHWNELAERSVTGVILSNELLDAFPAHRFGWDAQNHGWFEWGVQWEQDRFAWQPMPTRSALRNLATAYGPISWPGLSQTVDLADNLASVLPHGFTVEIGFAAESWWREAARRLGTGRLMTLDYGLSAEEFFLPERSSGTLRAFRRHHQAADPLVDPGMQDLTVPVNFTALRLSGESLGLTTEFMDTQAKFLTGMLRNDSLVAASSWTSHEVRQFQTLIHPDHFGRAFRLLVQRRS